MAQNALPPVQVQGTRSDGLLPIFGQVYSTLGQDPGDNMDSIRAQAQAYRKANPGLTEEELIASAKNSVPQMVTMALRQSTGYEKANQEDAAKANAARDAAAQDRYANRFVAPVAGLYARDPAAAQEQFHRQSDQFADAAQKSYETNKSAREADLQNQAKALTNRQEQFKTNLAAQGTLQQSNLNDPSSQESSAARAAAAQTLKSIGLERLSGNLDGMSANQIAGFMQGPAVGNLKARAEIANIGQTNATTRGTNAVAGLQELTTGAAQDAYRNTGQVPAAVEGQVFGNPDIARQQYGQKRLSELQEGAANRASVLTALDRVDELLRTSTPGPWNKIPKLGELTSNTPQMQKLAKELADVASKTSGGTDYAKQLNSAAQGDISKFPSVLASISQKIRAQVKKDDIVSQQLQAASKNGSLRDYNEVAERAKLRSVTYTNPDNGMSIMRVISIGDPEVKKNIEEARKRGFIVNIGE